jgi:hypothetical protein
MGKTSTPARKQRITGGITIKPYPFFCDLIEGGINRGWNRAHKHTDKPTEEQVKDAIYEAVMGDICEACDFHDEEASGL